MLRISLGIVFVWFGALKVVNASPVYDLIDRTVPLVEPSRFVPLLGLFEGALGIALLLGKSLRVVMVVFLSHMAATFVVLLVHTEVVFEHGNPLLLTLEGEFALKNLVLLTSGPWCCRRPLL